MRKLIKKILKDTDKELAEIEKAIEDVNIIADTALSVTDYLKRIPYAKGRELKRYLKTAKGYTEFLEGEAKKAVIDEKHILRLNRIIYNLIERAKKDIEHNKKML